MAVMVRRARDRFRTSAEGRETAHAFSFGDHYDPARTRFGLLVACNEDRLAPGSGYPPHQHAGLEIVTWVLSGVLEHEDSTGRRESVRPGAIQRLYAGSGVTHCERAGRDAAVTLVQAWVLPDDPTREPEYARGDVAADLAAGGWVALAGAGAAVPLRQRDAVLHACRLGAGDGATLPSAPYVHLHVARGSVELAGGRTLGTGDAAEVTGGGGEQVVAREPAELLCWQMHAPGAG